MKQFQCVCGVVKTNNEELISHVQRRHSNNNWYCAYPECKVTCKAKKAQKLHLRIIHLLDFAHYCWYCDYGRHDKNNVISHMAAKHGYRKSYQYSWCNKTFPTYFHLNRHTSTCGVSKCFVCQYCEKRFMHQGNLDNHIAIVHTQTKDKFKCNISGHEYSIKDSYIAHYQGYCKPEAGYIQSFEIEEHSTVDLENLDTPMQDAELDKVQVSMEVDESEPQAVLVEEVEASDSSEESSSSSSEDDKDKNVEQGEE